MTSRSDVSTACALQAELEEQMNLKEDQALIRARISSREYNMSAAAPGVGYSSSVRLQLIVGDDAYELAEIGPGSIYLSTPVSPPPCAAEVVMHVDDFERRWPVTLPDGVSPSSPLARTIPAQ